MQICPSQTLTDWMTSFHSEFLSAKETGCVSNTLRSGKGEHTALVVVGALVVCAFPRELRALAERAPGDDGRGALEEDEEGSDESEGLHFCVGSKSGLEMYCWKSGSGLIHFLGSRTSFIYSCQSTSFNATNRLHVQLTDFATQTACNGVGANAGRQHRYRVAV